MRCTCSKAAHCGLVPQRQFQDYCTASGRKGQSDLGVEIWAHSNLSLNVEIFPALPAQNGRLLLSCVY